MTENLTNIMLNKLKQRGLVCINNNDYQFCGVPRLLNYLESEKETLNNNYNRAIHELKDFFGEV